MSNKAALIAELLFVKMKGEVSANEFIYHDTIAKLWIAGLIAQPDCWTAERSIEIYKELARADQAFATYGRQPRFGPPPVL